jgi:uncharacterized membrane protein
MCRPMLAVVTAGRTDRPARDGFDAILWPMQILPGWHPIVVHFAVALSIGGAMALLVARYAPGTALARNAAVAGSVNLGSGALFCLLAIVSGVAAVWDLHLSGAARAAVSIHVIWAFFTTLAVLLLAVWRVFGAAAEERPSDLFVVIMVAAIAAVAVTAYLGGENVYRHGIGVLGR